MASLMGKVKHRGGEESLYPWGTAELRDKWVILYKQGDPKWAISYRQKRPSVVIPCDQLSSKKNVGFGRAEPRKETNV